MYCKHTVGLQILITTIIQQIQQLVFTFLPPKYFWAGISWLLGSVKTNLCSEPSRKNTTPIIIFVGNRIEMKNAAWYFEWDRRGVKECRELMVL